MNVLNLFGGMEVGRIAMDRANISVDKYLSAENDPYAIKIANKNYPDIIQLGDVIMDMNEYYKQLEGFSINKYLGEGEDGFPKFLLKAPNYAPVTIEVSADEEGNYGGFLFINTDEKENV